MKRQNTISILEMLGAVVHAAHIFETVRGNQLHGGKRSGAGRPKGVPNKANAERQAAIVASGLAPLDYLLSVLRDESADPHERMEAAKSAAPYVHPRLASIEHGGKDGSPIELKEIKIRLVKAQPDEDVPT
jgi:hypothetical protein